MHQILASGGANIVGGTILAILAITGIVITIKIGVIILAVKYIAKEIGKEVANKFDYDYMAKMVAYEMKKGTIKVIPKKVENIEQSDPEQN